LALLLDHREIGGRVVGTAGQVLPVVCAFELVGSGACLFEPRLLLAMTQSQVGQEGASARAVSGCHSDRVPTMKVKASCANKKEK
jgi:hypothetical protein